jgi:hypothetical protein
MAVTDTKARSPMKYRHQKQIKCVEKQAIKPKHGDEYDDDQI